MAPASMLSSLELDTWHGQTLRISQDDIAPKPAGNGTARSEAACLLHKAEVAGSHAAGVRPSYVPAANPVSSPLTQAGARG